VPSPSASRFSAVPAATVNVEDTITVTEAVSVSLTSYIGVSDDITLTEAVDLDIVGFVFSINVSDTITVTESITVFGKVLYINVYDSVGRRQNRLIMVDGNLALAIGRFYHIGI